MAEVFRHEAFITLIDSKAEKTTRTFRVSDADADAYMTAADPTAAGATDVGLLLSRFSLCTDAIRVEWGVRRVVENDTTIAAPAPDADVYHSDKLTIGYLSIKDNYIITIPAWKRSAFTHVGRDGYMDLTAPTQAANLKTSFDAVVLSPNGNPSEVQYFRKGKN